MLLALALPALFGAAQVSAWERRWIKGRFHAEAWLHQPPGAGGILSRLLDWPLPSPGGSFNAERSRPQRGRTITEEPSKDSVIHPARAHRRRDLPRSRRRLLHPARPDKRTKRLVAQFERLGHTVTLQGPASRPAGISYQTSSRGARSYESERGDQGGRAM